MWVWMRCVAGHNSKFKLVGYGVVTVFLVTVFCHHCHLPKVKQPACPPILNTVRLHSIMALHSCPHQATRCLGGEQRGSRVSGRTVAGALHAQQQQPCVLPHHVWGCGVSGSSLPSSSNRSCSSSTSSAHSSSRRQPVRCRVVSPEQPAAAATEPALSATQSLSSLEEASSTSCVPEDFELPSGVLGAIDRTSPPASEDAYRCPGCTQAECQVCVGCVGWVCKRQEQKHTLPSSKCRFIFMWGVAQIAPGAPTDAATCIARQCLHIHPTLCVLPHPPPSSHTDGAGLCSKHVALDA